MFMFKRPRSYERPHNVFVSLCLVTVFTVIFNAQTTVQRPLKGTDNGDEQEKLTDAMVSNHNLNHFEH